MSSKFKIGRTNVKHLEEAGLPLIWITDKKTKKTEQAQQMHLANRDELGFEVMEHPSYSPDLTPYDYYLFPPVKDAFLRGRQFTTDEEVKEAVQGWLK